VPEPSRGEVWLINLNLNPSRGHEQAGVRPGLVVSVDPSTMGQRGLSCSCPSQVSARASLFTSS